MNNKGAGDYIDGFAPTCAASDDLTKQLGDPTERQLAAALAYRNTGVCAASSSASDSVKKTLTDSDENNPQAVREFARPSDQAKLMLPTDGQRGNARHIEPKTPTLLGTFAPDAN